MPPCAKPRSNWGNPPWKIDFLPQPVPLPKEVDFAIVGGGFTGLAAAACLCRLMPGSPVVVLEAQCIGEGASGRTGGLVLGETAGGDLPALGDVLAGFADILGKLDVDGEISLPGAWEIARHAKPKAGSPIRWKDSGELRVVAEVPGGTIDPGRLVSGLAGAAVRQGALIIENARVDAIEWRSPPTLELGGRRLRAGKILFATNALSVALAGFDQSYEPRLTLAIRSAPLPEKQLEDLGLRERKPFYTSDLPYLWGRVCRDNSIVWGAGLVSAPGSRDLYRISIASEECSRLLGSLEARVHALHPALRDVRITHRWGGPILFRESWLPAFGWHPKSRSALVLGAFAGHGVALSSYLGAWAAEALVGRRELPAWGKLQA
ncbi:MAG TPA: FAD-binding oxidoreductase [Candidatus Cybelea sp.]|nr:FAD-binding oxidoreductase [Candidatus Cybelea sp.]